MPRRHQLLRSALTNITVSARIPSRATSGQFAVDERGIGDLRAAQIHVLHAGFDEGDFVRSDTPQPRTGEWHPDERAATQRRCRQVGTRQVGLTNLGVLDSDAAQAEPGSGALRECHSVEHRFIKARIVQRALKEAEIVQPAVRKIGPAQVAVDERGVLQTSAGEAPPGKVHFDQLTASAENRIGLRGVPARGRVTDQPALAGLVITVSTRLAPVRSHSVSRASERSAEYRFARCSDARSRLACCACASRQVGAVQVRSAYIGLVQDRSLERSPMEAGSGQFRLAKVARVQAGRGQVRIAEIGAAPARLTRYQPNSCAPRLNFASPTHALRTNSAPAQIGAHTMDPDERTPLEAGGRRPKSPRSPIPGPRLGSASLRPARPPTCRISRTAFR